jgi:hypothetical protein
VPDVIFLDNPFAPLAALDDLLKGSCGGFYRFTGLHNANLLKKYHFSLESEKKLPYNTFDYVSSSSRREGNRLYKENFHACQQLSARDEREERQPLRRSMNAHL